MWMHLNSGAQLIVPYPNGYVSTYMFFYFFVFLFTGGMNILYEGNFPSFLNR